MKEPSRAEGTLFVVATPIGNLKDITVRALEVLKRVDVIAAEGINRTRALCQHYGIRSKIRSFNQHNQKKVSPEFISLLRSGKSIALVTNAGTPCISDPGTCLVSLALQAGITVTPIPGPSAVTAALSASGIRADKFVFLGFLPAKQGQRSKELRRWKGERLPLVIYEAPHRIKDTLRDMLDIMGDVYITVLRELTKVHEEIRRERVSETLELLKDSEVKGEIVLVVEAAEKVNESINEDIKTYIGRLVSGQELPIKQIAAKVSAERGIPYRKTYKACLEILRRQEQDGDDAKDVH